MFVFRKLAEDDGTPRVYRYDSMTGERLLVDPTNNQPKPWPLKGVTIEGQIPRLDRISMDFVARAVAEGWMTWVNHRVDHKPGGPPDDEWLVTHTFHQADRIVMHLLLPDDSKFAQGGPVKRDLVYNVVTQPGKYKSDAKERSPKLSAERFPEPESETYVDWTFQLELVEA